MIPAQDKWFRKTLLVVVTILSFQPRESQAEAYFGRMSLGSYVANEADDVSYARNSSNNYNVLSSRLFLKAYDLDSSQGVYLLDVRDENNFYGSLNQDLLQLESKNVLQVTQCNAKWNVPSDLLAASLGRFSIQDAGGAYVDGVELGFRNGVVKGGVFGGLNPKRQDQTYVSFNSNSHVLGTYLVYPRNMGIQNSDSDQEVFGSTSLIANLYSGHLDRFYSYNHLNYRWGKFGRKGSGQIYGMLYFDFVPHLNIQYGNLNYHQEISETWSSQYQLMSLDVIEYARYQGILETLALSPYRESNLSIRYKFSDRSYFNSNWTYGIRSSDSLARAEISLGPSFYRLWGSHLSFKTLAGVRRNFIANDVFIQLGTDYYSKDWEFNFTLDYANDAQNYGPIRNKWVAEISASHDLTKEWVGSLSIQEAQTQNVQIWAGYLKLNYLFGEKELSPHPSDSPVSGVQKQRWRM